MKIPEALPPAPQDRAVLAGQEIQQRYLTEATAIRGEYGITELERAERLNDLWTRLEAELTSKRQAFDARYRGRFDELWAMVPSGPEAPAGASPADRAVLTTAYRTARDTAREQSHEQRLQALEEADRFGDEAARRAILDVLREDNKPDAVHAWAAKNIDPDWVPQIVYLVGLLFGATMDGMVAQRALKPLVRPTEVTSLPSLRQRDEADRARHEREQRTSVPAWGAPMPVQPGGRSRMV